MVRKDVSFARFDGARDISIVIPCYKVERYVARCLDSLVHQTWDSLEIICINDGSPDRCLDILRDYQRRYPELITIIDKDNEGVWRGRRDAIAIARGDYIGFVDSDDYVREDFCERLLAEAKAQSADIVVGGFQRIDAVTGRVNSTELAKPRCAFEVHDNPERLLELNGAPWNKLFKAALLKDLPELSRPPKIFDDMILQLLIYPRARRVAFLPEPLVFYVIRDDSIMTTIEQSQVLSLYDSMLELKALYLERNYDDLIAFLDAAAFLHLGVSLMFRMACDPTADLSRELKDNRLLLDECFPLWRSSACISARNAFRYGSTFQKLFLAKKIYETPLMAPMLQLYAAMIERFHRDIKW